MKKYNIGLDIGTTSVGWAAVDFETNQVLRKGRKALWGVSLFEEGDKAEDRRLKRGFRRRYERRRQRINLLQEQFKGQLDDEFFTLLKESFFQNDDFINKTIPLTKQLRLSHSKYSEKNPTIYHLRNQLVLDDKKEDLRLVYLAIHHIIKYRGNFNHKGGNFNPKNIKFKESLTDIFNCYLELENDLEFNDTIFEEFDYKKFEEIILLDSKNDIKVEIKNLFENYFSKQVVGELQKLFVGNEFDLAKFFNKEIDKAKISYSGTSYEDKIGELESSLEDKEIEILNSYKELFENIYLKKLFKGADNLNISSLMVDRYLKHKDHLKWLKSSLKSNKEIYNKMFKDKKNPSIYRKYVNNKMTYDEFRKEIEKTKINIDKYKNEIENGLFMPRITDSDNGKYPYQLNEYELIKIIENQGKYYPFLLEKINGEYKLVKLLKFRIPYYVGPLVSEKQSKNAWMERRSGQEHVKITPYNFEEVVDLDLSAEKFIKRMISHCTYLLDEYAMPANSILYSKFKVLNELKQIKVNGVILEKNLRDKIYNELFLTSGENITDKKFKNYLKSINAFPGYDTNLDIKGYSGDERFANNMKSYYDFFGENGIFNDTNYGIEDADQIIEWITIFEDKTIVERKVKKNYPKLTDKALNSILNKKYKGWSSLSKKLLETKYYTVKETSELKSILDLLEETDENFMQILNNDKYKFQKFIQEINMKDETKELSYELVEKLATSPANKKGIYQALKIVKEVVDYIGYEPTNIILEMARGEEEKKRTKSRYKQLDELYKNHKDTIEDYELLIKELKGFENLDAYELNERVFLYFIQEGRSLYSGRKMNLSDIMNNELYEIDHILPRSIIKDNSLDNKALVYREENQIKKDSLVVPSEYRNKSHLYWERLKNNGLMTPKKMYRLTRKTYSDEDIKGFINRQIVETRQITKHVANIINNFYKKSNVLYINASISSNYRDKFELFKFRDLNDYHHAHDAYLVAVLGKYRVYNLKENISFEEMKKFNNTLWEKELYKDLKYGYVINSLDPEAPYFYNEETGEITFDRELFNKTIENTLYRNDIIVTHKPEYYDSAFFNETVEKKGCTGVSLKKNWDTSRYGGYNSLKCSYLCLVKYGKKQKLIGIPYLIDLQSKQDISIKYDFIKEHLNSENISILRDEIPFNSTIKIDDCIYRIKGYSLSKKGFELCNNVQFKIPKELNYNYKYILNYVLNHKTKYYFDKKDLLLGDLKKLFEFQINYINTNYSCFKNVVSKINNDLNFINDEEKLSKLIYNLFIMCKANSANANLNSIISKGTDREGRMNGKSITNGTIIYSSPAGLKNTRYEF